MLFVMYFGWYFRLYFGFFTSETISDDISGAFRIFGLEIKKKNIRQGPWDPLESLCTEFICYYLLVSRNIWSCILFLGVEHTVELVQLVFDLTKEISH